MTGAHRAGVGAVTVGARPRGRRNAATFVLNALTDVTRYAPLLVLGLLALSPCAAAQERVYLGLRLAGASGLEEPDIGFLPFLGLQAGVRVAGPLELRAAYDLSLGVSYASADLLYAQPLGDGFRGYAGAGPDYYADGWNGETDGGVHAVAGLEYRTGSAGFFAEVAPVYGFGVAALRVRSSLGVNLHF